ncbi:putative septation protein SpoVG [bacterium BMS3Abin04]|nr:putative septation protein SpoVG [bacterium BMS3Abin04]
MKINRMNPYDGNTKTKAFFDLETEEGIIIKGFTLVEGTNGLFVSVPSEKGKDDKYYDKVLISKELRTKLNDLALEKYNELSAQTA